MSAVEVVQNTSGVSGSWRIQASVAGGRTVDVTYFRRVQTLIGNWTREDPFGPKTLQLTFPAITLFDALGAAELDFLRPFTDFDLVWNGPLPAGYPDTEWRWEGYSVSFDRTGDGLVVSLVGAMQQFDNYLAKPGYLSRPLPYEAAIANQWDGRPDLRLKNLSVVYPAWWQTFYTPVVGQPLYLQPTDVYPGAPWTGLLTRTTGSWEPTLTSYITTLLSTMYTDRGRWTIDLLPRRKPVLRHRDFVIDSAGVDLTVDPAAPGVECSLNEDWSQSINALYGQGQSLSGQGFSGQETTADGLSTYYKPLAATRQVFPQDDENGWYDPAVMTREVLLQVQAGLELEQAQDVAGRHIQRFITPGVTGSITLRSDPAWKTGGFLPRGLIKEGMSLLLKRYGGSSDGVVLFISSVSYDSSTGAVTLSVDSKFRDALTLDEVKVRGRDALAISRQLVAGQYTPPIPDSLVPWNYTEGSGIIPSGNEYSAVGLFRDMPRDVQFPWTEWTTTHPPADKAWASSYIHIGPRGASANDNWSKLTDRQGSQIGFPIKMAQAGQIRLLQIGAYDIAGNLMPVSFHFSLYTARGVNYANTPILASAADIRPGSGYQVGQHDPFFKDAWEQFTSAGTRIQTEVPVQVGSAGLVRAFGTGFVKCGYWPGSSATEDPVTGALVDEGIFDFDTTGFDSSFNPFSLDQASDAGLLYCLIFCEDQGANDVYFLGRMFRVEPGTNV